MVGVVWSFYMWVLVMGDDVMRQFEDSSGRGDLELQSRLHGLRDAEAVTSGHSAGLRLGIYK